MNFEVVKHVLEQLQLICNQLDENEISIIKKYGNEAKRYTIIIILLNICYMIAIYILPMLPHLLGVIMVINESEFHTMMPNTLPKYIIDQENYYSFIWLFTNVALSIGGITMIGTELIFLVYCKYICGIFEIVSYRIAKAMTISRKKEIMICKGIICAVDIHCKAVKIIEFFSSNFQRSHFFVMLVGVACLSLNLYGLSETAILRVGVNKFYIRSAIVIAIFILFFLINSCGQEITDQNEFIFRTAYNVQWYIAPLHVQRMILFLLQRGSKALYLSFGGLFIMSIEFFATLMKVSASYFTIVYSTQH